MATPPPQRPASGVPASVWIAALLAALLLVAWATGRQARHYAKVSAAYGVAVRAPAADPASPTGFADGRRTLAYPARWVDGQHWIMHTQQMLATGEWRLRHTDDDNAPAGRDVHWAAPFRWWLGLGAAVDHALTGRPLGSAAEHAALFANPALLALLLLTLVPWTARRFGSAAAAFLALAMVGTPPFAVLFSPDNMDHHGLIQACAMVTLLALLGGGSGWTRPGPAPAAWAWLPDPAQARRAFTFAGVAGGIGLWVSAASLVPVFAGIGLGALGGAWLGRDAPTFARFDPGLWRRWGLTGGATALGCWLLEYFPSHLAWRLEVNHPLHALAWAGAGEVLAQATAWLAGDRRPRDHVAWLRLGAGLLALAAPVVLIALARDRVFVVADPFLWWLSHDYTPEFKGLPAALLAGGLNATTVASCLPMLAAVLAGAWLSRRTVPGLARAVAAVPFAATLLFWAMAMKELRWWTVGYGFLFGLIVVLAAVTAATGLQRGRLAAGWLVLAVLFVPGLVVSVKTVANHAALTADDLHSLAERDLAHALRLRAGAAPLVVLGAPATTSRLVYFGGAQGLGTAYWENLAGMKRAAAILAAKTADEARELIRAAGVTHLVLLPWDDFTDPYVRLARGLPAAAPLTETAFGLELRRAAEPPAWLRRLPDHLPDLPLFRQQPALVFEVTERDRPEQALVRTVRQLLYRGQLAAARSRIPELEKYPGDLAAQVARARVHYAAQDAGAFADTLARVESLPARLADLEPEDRMDLVAVFALGGRLPEARRQLEEALPGFDETAIRRLTPGSLKNLLGLTARLGVAWPEPRLQRLAAELLPPDGRL